jgi:hypothetical protein
LCELGEKLEDVCLVRMVLHIVPKQYM